MRRFSIALVAGAALVGCSEDSGSDGGKGANGAGEPATEVGPVSFQLPEGVEEIFLNQESDGGWVAEYSDDEEAPDSFVGVWRFPETPPSASDGAGELRVQVGMAETHPGIQLSEGGEVEIAGADDAYTIDLSGDDGEQTITGRWWILLDHNEDVAAAVEYYGYDLSQEELDAFADSLEMKAEQGW